MYPPPRLFIGPSKKLFQQLKTKNTHLRCIKGGGSPSFWWEFEGRRECIRLNSISRVKQTQW